MDSFNFSPIGYFESHHKNKYDAPRQSVEDESASIGKLVLKKGFNLEQGLKGLEGFERLWIIYQFHKNENWKPLTQTPRATDKQGVFATRSPYRPNPIGMSCVKLIKIEGNTIWLSGYDILDGTPVLDIKPYIPSCDRFDVQNESWIEEESKKEVRFSKLAEEQLGWLSNQGLIEIKGAVVDQLSRDPINSKKKRLRDLGNNIFELSYRTWRLRFEYQEAKGLCLVLDLYSGYSREDMTDSEDIYQDKPLHLKFSEKYA